MDDSTPPSSSIQKQAYPPSRGTHTHALSSLTQCRSNDPTRCCAMKRALASPVHPNNGRVVASRQTPNSRGSSSILRESRSPT